MKKSALITVLLTAGVAIILILSLIYIDEVKDGIISAVERCVFGIVPSLFLMGVMSSVIIRLVGSIRPKRISSGIFQMISVFILGNICGYPIGAKVLAELMDDGEISKNQAERAICYSYSSGPAYVLGIVSGSVFHSRALGTVAFCSCLISNLVLFIYFSFRYKCQSNSSTSVRLYSFTDSVMNAVTTSAYSMITICSSIVFFSALTAIFRKVIPVINASEISAILEISNIVNLDCKSLAMFVVSCALLSFGGFCVHMQIKCIVGSRFSLKLFYLTRPIQVAIASAVSAIIYILISSNVDYEVFASSGHEVMLSSSGNIIPFVCTAGMILIAFTYKIGHSNDNGRL